MPQIYAIQRYSQMAQFLLLVSRCLMPVKLAPFFIVISGVRNTTSIDTLTSVQSACVCVCVHTCVFLHRMCESTSSSSLHTRTLTQSTQQRRRAPSLADRAQSFGPPLRRNLVVCYSAPTQTPLRLVCVSSHASHVRHTSVPFSTARECALERAYAHVHSAVEFISACLITPRGFPLHSWASRHKRASGCTSRCGLFVAECACRQQTVIACATTLFYPLRIYFDRTEAHELISS